MARSLITFPLLLMATLPAFAQRAPLDPPVVGRPEDFSNIVGKYRLNVSAEPLEVNVEDPITLHVRITGDGPPKYQPKRQHLQILPDWSDDFYVENVPDEDRVLPDEKTWLFVYRLRPKHVNVKEIDGIKLVYYDPKYLGKNKYLPDYTPAIAINVKPKPDLTGDMRAPVAAPDSFYQINQGEDVLARTTPTFSLSAVSFAILLAVPPLACLLGAWTWRRVFPDERRRRARHRSQAAQRALAHLKAGRDSTWSIVRTYLHERFDFGVDDPTPADVTVFLKQRGFAMERYAKGQAFFQRCDAVRFTNAMSDPTPLIDDASHLIQALEADPCAH